MATNDKHILLSEKALELVTNRDRKRFPMEKDFINEAIVSYEDRMEIRKLSNEFKELKKTTERLYKTVGWR